MKPVDEVIADVKAAQAETKTHIEAVGAFDWESFALKVLAELLAWWKLRKE